MFSCFSAVLQDLERLQDAELLLLDMEIADQSGVAFGKKIRQVCPWIPVVIVSQYPQYLKDGYTIQAERYFLKPLDPQVVEFEMEGVLSRPSLMQKKRLQDPRLPIPFIPISQILWMEVTGHTLEIVLQNQMRLTARISLQEAQQMVEGCGFGRNAKYCLVNLQAVRSISANSVEVGSGNWLPVSRHYKKTFLEACNQFLEGHG